MYKKTKISIILVASFLAVPALAQGLDTSKLSSLFITATNFISDNILPMLVAVALLFFIVWVVNFISNADNAEERRKWRNVFIWGILALFLMFSAIGAIRVLTQTFFGESVVLPKLPESKDN